MFNLPDLRPMYWLIVLGCVFIGLLGIAAIIAVIWLFQHLVFVP